MQSSSSASSALSSSIVFVDHVTALTLRSLHASDVQSQYSEKKSASKDLSSTGLKYLIEQKEIRNIIDFDSASVAATSTSATSINSFASSQSQTSSTHSSKQLKKKSEPTPKQPKSGWDVDLDFGDVNDDEDENDDADEEEIVEEEKKSFNTTTPPQQQQQQQLIYYRSLNTSHSDLIDTEILAMLPDEVTNRTSKTVASAENRKSSKGKQQKSKQNDEWGWDEDGDAEEQKSDEESDEDIDSSPSSTFDRIAAHSTATSTPATPALASTRACFLLSSEFANEQLVRITDILVNSRTVSSSESADISDWKEVHLLTPTKLTTAAATEIKQALTGLLRERRTSSQKAEISVHVQYMPLSHITLELDTKSNSNEQAFLIPLPASSTSSSPATYPPSYPLASRLTLSKLSESIASAASATTPSHSSGNTAAASSTASDSSFFSSIAKGFNDHMREAEEIAMHGKSHSSSSSLTSSATSNPALTSALITSLSSTLHSMNLQPDLFTIGHATKELGEKVLERMRELKEMDEIEVSALMQAKSKSKKTSQVQPPPPTPSSLVLIERSLDLLTVARHHPVTQNEVYDRALTEYSPWSDTFLLSEIKRKESSAEEKSIDEIAKEIEAKWDDESIEEKVQKAQADSFFLDTADLRHQLFTTATTSSTSSSTSSSELRSHFPPPLSSHTSRLLDELQQSNSASSNPTPKVVLNIVLKHVTSLITSCSIKAPSSASASSSSTVPQLCRAIRSSLDAFKTQPYHQLIHHDFLMIVETILTSFAPPSQNAKSMYERLLNVEALLLAQYSAQFGGGSTDTSLSQDDATQALSDLVKMMIDFVRGVMEESNDVTSTSSSSHSLSRLTLLDILRLYAYLYSLIGGRHLISENDTQELVSLLMDAFAQYATVEEKSWLAASCRLEVEESTWSTDELNKKSEQLFTNFLLQLQSTSLTRSEFTASDLIDLTAPLEGADDDNSTSSSSSSSTTPHPFVTRLFHRIQHSELLLDELEHEAFDESDAADDQEQKEKDQLNDSTHDSQQGAISDPSHPASSPSSWSFLGSLASAVVSSVAATTAAPLKDLGFSSRVARPEQRSVLVLFVVGGITHTEMRQLRAQVREWKKSDELASTRTVMIGSTHVATPHDLVRHLLRAAAKATMTSVV